MAQTLTVSQILADLQAGLTRAEIGEKYGLNGIQVKALFKNQKLKNKKTIKEKGAAFILVDDTEPVVTPAPEVVENNGSQENADIHAEEVIIPPIDEATTRRASRSHVSAPEPPPVVEQNNIFNAGNEEAGENATDETVAEPEQSGSVWGS